MSNKTPTTRIELLRSVMLNGDTEATKARSVLEGSDKPRLEEFKSLVTAGVAKYTDKAANRVIAQALGSDHKPVSGVTPAGESEAARDTRLNAILAGTIQEVDQRIIGLSRDDLVRLGDLNIAHSNSRNGVADSVEKAIAAIDNPGEG